jgi:glycogen synthase
MHVLITADTVGGVWTYTRDLVRGLAGRGHRVTLVSLGALPRPDQVAWCHLPGVDYRATSYRLEWMQDSERDLEASRAYLGDLIRQVRPDLLHFNQYCYGDIEDALPRIVVAHSDVVSWWVAVHGREPEESSWIRWYRDAVVRSLQSADVVVAPSQWMLDALGTYYRKPRRGVVIHNGRDPDEFDAESSKENLVLSVGRLWDEAKQVSLLFETTHGARVCIAGSTEQPGRAAQPLPWEIPPKLEFRGAQSQAQLRALYARASIYAATSCYEPFGLAPLEAAFSRCALLANDIPVFQELWGDAALYFGRDEAKDLAFMVRVLNRNPKLRRRWGDLVYDRARSRFSLERMLERYESLYEQVSGSQKLATRKVA